jgi:hypothetical protein
MVNFLDTSKTKLRGRSPQANYIDRATAACRRSRQPLRVEGVAWSAQRIPTAVNHGIRDQSRYFFIQVAPQFSSCGWMDPVPDPLLLRKSGRAGNRTRDLWISSQKLWPLDHRGDILDIVKSENTMSNDKNGSKLEWIWMNGVKFVTTIY